MTQPKKALEYIEDLIRINGATKKLFQKRKIFLSERYGFPSYYAIRGKKPHTLPNTIPLEYKTWPVINQDKKELLEIEAACERLGRKFFHLQENEDLQIRNREYMIEGSTLPIKVTYERLINEKKGKKEEITTQIGSIYVKEINLNRIYIGFLYALATRKEPNFFFSENSVIEQEVKGINLIDAYNIQPDFLTHPHWKRELVRLSVLTNFLSLNDCDNGYNIIVTPKKEFVIIDFDKAFWEKMPQPSEQIINPFVYKVKRKKSIEIYELPDEKLTRHFAKRELETLIKQEKNRIVQNISLEMDKFHETINAMSSSRYYNAAVKELYEEKDVTSYFLKKLFEFGRA